MTNSNFKNMEINYFDQINRNYPQDKEYLKWLNVKLDRNIYFYGPNFRFAQDKKPSKSFRELIKKTYRYFQGKRVSYDNAFICDAYFNVGKHIKKQGYNVLLPPWVIPALSSEAMKTSEMLSIWSQTDFNILLSNEFKERVYNLKEELKIFFKKNHTPFVLFANGEQPLYRIAMDACKEIGVPTGVFLHGLPARYNINDNYYPDYLFVWGEKIKLNFEKIYNTTKIIVAGHPYFSQYEKQRNIGDSVVVLTQAINFSGCARDYLLSDAGSTIQYVYAVERVLKALGYKKAILRPHPSESNDWYRERMDINFYSLDVAPLDQTLTNAKFFVGPISTVVLNAVYSDIPYFVYIVDPTTNRFSWPTVPPFTADTNMPVSHTEEELLENIKLGKSVKKEHFNGYIDPQFNVSAITNLANK